jgi:hypothetical protein
MKQYLIAAMLLAATPAMALNPGEIAQLEPGSTIKFRDPRPLAVGCTDHADARRIRQFNKQRDEYAKQELVDWLRNSTERICIIFNNSPDTGWKVVKRVVVERSAWVCFAAEYDFRPVSEQKQPAPCLWLFMP